jgi:hypothetical protein
MLRKDIDSHEDAALKQHNRLLLGKVKAQQRTTLQQQQINQYYREKQQKELEELNEAHWRLKQLVGIEEIVLRVKHSELTGREPFVPRYAVHPTSLYSEYNTLQRHGVWINVQTRNEKPENQDHYGFYLTVVDGPFPCKATFTLELVHHDGNPQSAVKWEEEYTFTEGKARGRARFISKARLASPDNNPYVKDGYVTFRCTFKLVDE